MICWSVDKLDQLFVLRVDKTIPDAVTDHLPQRVEVGQDIKEEDRWMSSISECISWVPSDVLTLVVESNLRHRHRIHYLFYCPNASREGDECRC